MVIFCQVREFCKGLETLKKIGWQRKVKGNRVVIDSRIYNMLWPYNVCCKFTYANCSTEDSTELGEILKWCEYVMRTSWQHSNIRTLTAEALPAYGEEQCDMQSGRETKRTNNEPTYYNTTKWNGGMGCVITSALGGYLKREVDLVHRHQKPFTRTSALN